MAVEQGEEAVTPDGDGRAGQLCRQLFPKLTRAQPVMFVAQGVDGG